jgi:hypothetical protein
VTFTGSTGVCTLLQEHVLDPACKLSFPQYPDRILDSSLGIPGSS